ncbi:hypothetical protein ID866_10239 [Astraeus odoratus]|nr:hypothetical protein ID866_10239 [Astraeus odoratus]
MVARVGKFTTQQCDHFKPSKNVTPADIRMETDQNGFITTVFALPHTKAAANREEVQWAKQEGPTDPHSALEAHLTTNNPPTDSPLFTYRNGQSHSPLLKATFLWQLKVAAKEAGHITVQGHGIRIGATLKYLLRGVPFNVMKVKGHWASDAFQTYLCKHNQILALYIQAMPSGMAMEFTRLAMPPVR